MNTWTSPSPPCFSAVSAQFPVVIRRWFEGSLQFRQFGAPVVPVDPLPVVAQHWFTSLLHARTVIETWRRDYNEERPKDALGGLTPAGYARQLIKKAATMDPGL